jgi:formate-dependent nitrite reductase membrane component NrfD
MEGMFYSTQEVWTWWIAIYLFLGGLGGAAVVASCFTNMHLKEHKALVLWGNISAFIMLSVGSLFLFLHLLDHFAVYHVLNPLIIYYRPEAWIAWGTQFIVWMMVWSMVYTLPYMLETPFWRDMPVVGMILGWFKWLGCSVFEIPWGSWLVGDYQWYGHRVLHRLITAILPSGGVMA